MCLSESPHNVKAKTEAETSEIKELGKRLLFLRVVVYYWGVTVRLDQQNGNIAIFPV